MRDLIVIALILVILWVLLGGLGGLEKEVIAGSR
jgi:hypothetical protein